MGSLVVTISFTIKLSKPVVLRHKRQSFNLKKENFNHFKDLLMAADQCIPKVTLSRKKRLNLRSTTREDHKVYLEELTNNLQNDQRAFWRWLKNTRSGNSSIPSLNYLNKVLTSPTDKTEALNDYFCSVFTNENLSSLRGLRDQLAPD